MVKILHTNGRERMARKGHHHMSQVTFQNWSFLANTPTKILSISFLPFFLPASSACSALLINKDYGEVFKDKKYYVAVEMPWDTPYWRSHTMVPRQTPVTTRSRKMINISNLEISCFSCTSVHSLIITKFNTFLDENIPYTISSNPVQFLRI